MRPHRLRVSGFGPFAETVEVDLDLLSGSGLFLLHGDTGAGKTTLLDALGFALYGRVPGVRNDAKRLRSDHAGPDTPTEVQLEATLAGRRMRITRSPEYVRPKRTGTGTTEQKGRVLLEELRDGAWTTVSTAHREAGDVLLDLVGMSAEQFFQVVLLPQGEFARFLRADSVTRAALLERLFGTGLYRSAEEWLSARRQATARAVEELSGQVALATARVAQAAGVDEPEEVTAGWGEQLLVAAVAAEREALAAATVATARRGELLAVQGAALRLASAQRRRRELLAEHAALAERRAEVDRLRTEAAAAGRAAEVAPALDQLTSRDGEVEAARQQLAAARAGLPSVGLTADAAIAELDAAAEAAGRRIGALEALRPLAAEIVHEQQLAAVAEAEATQARAEVVRLTELLTELPPRRTSLAQALAAARAAATQLPGVQARCELLRQASRDAEALDGLGQAAGQLREELLLARETAVALRDKAADVREGRLEAIRFELASMLVDGDPCPVCGSLFHPDPSEARGERVTREDEDTARAAAEAAQQLVEELGRRLAAVEAESAGLRDRLGDQSGPAVAAALVTVTAEAAALTEGAASLPACEQALQELDAEQAAAETARAATQVTADEAARRAQTAGTRARSGQERLTAQLDGATDLEAASRAAASVVALAEQVLAAEAALVRAEQELAGAQRDAADRAVAAGFPAASDAAAAGRAPSWRDDAADQLRSYDDACAATSAGLLDPELQVPLEPAADVAGSTEAVRVADEDVEQATAALARARGRLTALGDLVPALTGLVDRLGPVQARAREVRALADLVSGQGANAMRMTLSSFVLAARLEEVAAAATERLLRMTQGRYSLVHTDGTARGGARSGLGLLARDAWTGQDRDTSTLSGGETFLASLALALGLTDVVTAEAGGARIEALFVDEGFGTLDEETLDEVMDVLDGLREGGRVVGVVSHVAELRQRIPAQVRVTKGRAGSSLAVVGC